MIAYVNRTRSKGGRYRQTTYHLRPDCPVLRQTPAGRLQRVEVHGEPLGGWCWVCRRLMGHEKLPPSKWTAGG